MSYRFIPRGVCSRSIEFDLEDGKVRNARFTGGCDGNLKAVCKLIEGMDAEEVIRILQGNTCGMRQTSCADQLSVALTQALAKEKEKQN